MPYTMLMVFEQGAVIAHIECGVQQQAQRGAELEKQDLGCWRQGQKEASALEKPIMSSTQNSPLCE